MSPEVHQIGSERYRLWKGYVVAGARPEDSVRDLLAGSGPFANLPFRLRGNPRHPTALWIDGGFVRLHGAEARRRWFGTLGQAVAALDRAVAESGSQLLPNAVRPDPGLPWAPFLCSDLHWLEVRDDLERCSVHNLLRSAIPLLMAWTGRSGADRGGVEPLGSRRLSDSSDHFAARWLPSLGPRYLAHALAWYKAEAGVPGFEAFDLHPAPDRQGTEPSSLELRFCDGQCTLATVRCQTLIFQALALRARRLARSGQAPPCPRQQDLERARSRAITQGMDAQLEWTGLLSDAGHSERGRRSDEAVPSASALPSLFDELAPELHELEASYEEVGSLMAGPMLRDLGCAALRNENDLLRACQAAPEDGDFLASVRRLVLEASERDEIVQRNMSRFPMHAALVRSHGSARLAERPRDGWPEARSARPSSADRRPVEDPRATLKQALGTLNFDDANASQHVARLLQEYCRKKGGSALDRHLADVPDIARKVRRQLRSFGEFRQYASGAELGWDAEALRGAREGAGRRGLGLAVLLLPPAEKEAGGKVMKALSDSKPEGVELLTLYRGPQASEDGELYAVEVAIVSLAGKELAP